MLTLTKRIELAREKVQDAECIVKTLQGLEGLLSEHTVLDSLTDLLHSTRMLLTLQDPKPPLS